MANYSTLKAAIADYVKNRTGLTTIDGDGLQQSLLSMIDSLGGGYNYAGMATPTTNPGSPDDRVFYIATIPGLYTNFGGITINYGEFAIMKFYGVWGKESLPLPGLINDCVLQVGNQIDFYFGDDGTFKFNATDDFSSPSQCFIVFNFRNGSHPSHTITANDNTFVLTNEQRLVYNFTSQQLLVKNFNVTLGIDEIVIIERGYNTGSHKFGYVDGWAGGIVMPYLLNSKILAVQKEIDEINSSMNLSVIPFSGEIESYEVGDAKYVSENPGSYMGEIRPCAPGEIVKVMSAIANNTYSFAISFWSKRPTPMSGSQPEPTGFISGVKATPETSGVLSLYQATAPAGTAFVVVSTGEVNGGGFDGTGLVSTLYELSLIVKSNTERIEALEQSGIPDTDLYQERENAILACENINISFADLPVSADGTGIDSGFLYIDSNNNIKIKS